MFCVVCQHMSRRKKRNKSNEYDNKGMRKNELTKQKTGEGKGGVKKNSKEKEMDNMKNEKMSKN